MTQKPGVLARGACALTCEGGFRRAVQHAECAALVRLAKEALHHVHGLRSRGCRFKSMLQYRT